MPATIGALAASATFSQDVIDICGTVAPSLAYYGGDASGALELIGGSANLADGGAPGKEQTDHAFGVGTRTTEILDGSADQMIAAVNTVADVSTVPFAFLVAGQLVSTVGTVGLLGKRDPAGSNIGWELNHLNGGQLSFVVDRASGAAARNVALDHGTAAPFSALGTRLPTVNEHNLFTNLGSATGATNGETLSNTAKLTIGLGRQNSQVWHFALLLLWINAGEDFDSSHLAAFNAHFGI